MILNILDIMHLGTHPNNHTHTHTEIFTNEKYDET